MQLDQKLCWEVFCCSSVIFSRVQGKALHTEDLVNLKGVTDGKSSASEVSNTTSHDTHKHQHTKSELFLTLTTFSHHWRFCILQNFWQLLVSSGGLLEQDFLSFLHSPHVLTLPSLSLACSRFCHANKERVTTMLDRGRAEVRGHSILWYPRWREAGEERKSVHVRTQSNSDSMLVRAAHL